MSIAQNDVFDDNLFLVHLKGPDKSKKVKLLIIWLKTSFFLKLDFKHNEHSPKWRFRRELIFSAPSGSQEVEKRRIFDNLTQNILFS